MVSLRTRVQQIERSAPATPAYDHEAYRQRWIVAAERLFATMAPEHAQHVIDEWTAGRIYSQHGADRLTCAVSNLLYIHAQAHERYVDRPLALPPEVAQFYLDDLALEGAYDCRACGYIVPSVKNDTGRSFPAFERCPLCGGEIGYMVWRNPKNAQD